MAKFFNEESVYENDVNTNNVPDNYVPNFVGAGEVKPTVSGGFDVINNEQDIVNQEENTNPSYANDTFINNELNNNQFANYVEEIPNNNATGWNNNASLGNNQESNNNQMVLEENNSYQNESMQGYNPQEQVENETYYDNNSVDSMNFTNNQSEMPVDEYIEDDNDGNFVPLEQGTDNNEEEVIKNPVYDASLDANDKEVSGNPLACLLILIETFLFPSSSVIKNTEKYNNGKRVIKVYITIMIYLIIFALIGHIVGGCFVNRFVERYSSYRNVFDFSLLKSLNYVNIIIEVLVESFGITILFAIINYAMSFFSNKGVNFGSYLLLISLSFFPVLLYTSFLFPFLKTISFYFTLVIFIILLIYSLLIYFLSIKNVMEFSNENRLIRYILINVTIIIGASALILYILHGEAITTFLKMFY